MLSSLPAVRTRRLNVSLRARRQAAVVCLLASASLLAAFVWAQARPGSSTVVGVGSLGAVAATPNEAPAFAATPNEASIPAEAPNGAPAAASSGAPAAAAALNEGSAQAAATKGAATPEGGALVGRPVPSVEHVLLLTVDSLRGDQPWTGYPHVRTPNLSALAERSIVYERAYAVANVTAASLASLLSGRYPSELERTRCAVGQYRLGEGLAPFLKASGVTTSAAHGSAMFASYAAPSGGFDDWRLIEGAAGLGAHRSVVTGAALASLVEGTLASPPAGEHLFLWAHFVDPRHPYVPQADFPPGAPLARGVYDGEVAYTDAMIGRVLDALERSPLGKRTAVVVAGDHGEAFGEHGLYRHGRGAFDEEFHVPLMVYVPGVAPSRVTTPRSTIDIAPTVAALFRLTPPAHWRGRSLLDDLGPEGPVTRPVFFDSPEWQARPAMRAVILGRAPYQPSSSPAGCSRASTSCPPLPAKSKRRPSAPSTRATLRKARAMPRCPRARATRPTPKPGASRLPRQPRPRRAHRRRATTSSERSQSPAAGDDGQSPAAGDDEPGS
ncbi:MAG: sulfatase-like hydrolase/transferase [Polyangiaceae bacterium]|nr:sulfatase-like hydrolase/transferase [Polyangiaceae bacterium]